MKHDVFISYSRADSAIADRICDAFDKAGISYFIDRQGIGGGFEFPVVLAEAIIESKVVLFLASKSSYESRFTNAELTFAFNEKPKNSILPYIIDGSKMPPALRFVFSSINWRTIESHPIEPTLVDDILKMLGRDEESVLRAKAEEERKAKKKAAEEEARRKAEEQELKEQTRFWNEEIQREEKEKRLRYEQRQARIEKIKNIASIIVIVIVFSIGAVGIFVEAKRWWTERQEQQQITEQTADKVEQTTTTTSKTTATPERKTAEKTNTQQVTQKKATSATTTLQKTYATTAKSTQEVATNAKAEAEQNVEAKIQKALAEDKTEIDVEKFSKAFDKATQAAEKTYKVGDYYNDGTKEGVVFYVDATGKHGKIVSLIEKILPWCSEAQNKKWIAVGATSKTDGKANTDKVMARADSREYTAFVWCRNMGKDWYLPAIEELKLLLLNDAVYNAVNKTLENNLATKGATEGYWSSTQVNEFGAWLVFMLDSSDYYGKNKESGNDFPLAVRAVAQF